VLMMEYDILAFSDTCRAGKFKRLKTSSIPRAWFIWSSFPNLGACKPP
jgi:hypothetical protein